MSSRILRFRFEQEFGRHDAYAAIIEDPMVNLRLHGVSIAVSLIGSPVGAADTDKMNPQVAKLLHQLAIRTEIERPAYPTLHRTSEKGRFQPVVTGNNRF
jgi:hypothetical protein